MDWGKTKDEPKRSEPPEPPLDSILFRVVGQSARPIRCATYLTLFGTELRLEYEGKTDGIIRTQLFKAEPRRDEKIAETASQWRGALDGHGFTDLDVEEGTR